MAFYQILGGKTVKNVQIDVREIWTRRREVVTSIYLQRRMLDNIMPHFSRKLYNENEVKSIIKSYDNQMDIWLPGSCYAS